MINIKFKEFLNSYIYINLKKKLYFIIKKNININNINYICKKLSILYIFIYYILLYNKQIIIINFNKNINIILKEITNLINFYNINYKFLKLFNYFNIKKIILLFYWFTYIIINIKNIPKNLIKYFYKNYLKIKKKKYLFKLIFKKNYFIIINSINNINYINNKYIINIFTDKNNINGCLNIKINKNYLSYIYLLKIITLSSLKSKFNKYYF